MKRMIPFAPLLLLGALLLSPAAALSGARQGLAIWWEQVFPALLPSILSVRLAQNLGLLRLSENRPRGQLLAVIGFSLVSGAPNGAKLVHALREEGSLSARESERLLPFVNVVSPAFLLSVIASELLKNKALFLPMAAAFYGCILCAVFLQIYRKNVSFPLVRLRENEPLPFSAALSSAIENSMLDMLRVGGCILFVCTFLYLMKPLVPDENSFAALAALLEVSSGTAMVSGLSLPLQLKSSLLIGISAFGGLSLALQSMCFYPQLKLVPYLSRKFLLGVFVGLICYLLFPLFPTVSAVFADRQETLSRSLALGALLLSSALSLAFVGVLSLMICPRKKK